MFPREKDEEKSFRWKKVITLVDIFWKVDLHWNEKGDLRTWMEEASSASHKRMSNWKCTSESLVFLWEKPTAQQLNYSFWIVNDWFCLRKETEKYWLRFCKYLRKGHFSGMSGIKKGHTAWETRSEKGELSTTGAKWKRVQELFERVRQKACMGDVMEQRK